MSAEPTAEHVDAEPAGYPPVSAEHIDAVARVIYPAVTSTDPAVHAALAAALPAEVMLAALVNRGALTEEWRVFYAGSTIPTESTTEQKARRFATVYGDRLERRLVTPWEVAP